MKIDARSRLQYRLQSGVFVVLFIALLCCLAWVSNRFPLSFDLSANQRNIMLGSCVVQATRELTDPGFVRSGQCQCQRHPERTATHCRDIRKVDSDGAVAEVCRIDTCREMHAFDERINHRYEFTPRFGLQDGAIIADACDYAGCLALADEVALNQLELIHWSRCCAGTAMLCPGRH